MTDRPESLLQRILLGEDTSLELKTVALRGERVTAPQRDSLADEFAAIANTAGGTLVLGVDNKTREVPGIPLHSLYAVERFVFEICEDSITPPVAFQTTRTRLPDLAGVLQPILVVELRRSLFVHQSPGGYLRRQGSTKRAMPPDVLARLFQQRSQARLIHFDEQAIPQTSLGDLSEPLWRRSLGTSSDDDRTALLKLSILRLDDEQQDCATVSGILMC